MVDLLTSLGYNCTELNADICLQATQETGKEFLKPFYNIAKSAVESPKFKAYEKVIRKNTLNSATGDGSMTSKDKTQAGLDYIQQLGGIIGMFVNKNANDTTAQAEYERAAAERAKAEAEAAKTTSDTQTANTQKWLIPVIAGVGVLFLVVILVVVLSRRK